MISRKERMNEAYQYLRNNGAVHTQKDLAEALQTTEPNVSNILKGKEKALTDNIFVRLTVAYPGIFNLNYLLTGEGELLVSQSPKEVEREQGGIMAKVESLMERLERKERILDSQIAKLAKLIKGIDPDAYNDNDGFNKLT